MELLSMLGTTEKQGLALRQGSLSKYSTLTWPSLKDALHLKDQFVCSLGDRWHITGTRCCAPCQLAVWVSSWGPPLVGLYDPHTAVKASSPTTVCSCCSCPSQLLPPALAPAYHQLSSAPRKEEAHLPERWPLHRLWRADSLNDHWDLFSHRRHAWILSKDFPI